MSANGRRNRNVLNIDRNLQFDTDKDTLREFFADKVIPREYVDYFFEPDSVCWCRFDPELGYRPKGAAVRFGVDDTLTFERCGPMGERRMLNFCDQPCRINTYGDSFTECNQVSDGETWQEALAAHFGEPARNVGVGGYGVYQAYRRMLREESGPASAEYILLNIFDDDHFRNLHTFRGITRHAYPAEFSKEAALMFHANPWVHLRIVPETGEFVETKNPYPTKESLYELSDKQHLYDAFKDDFTVQMIMARTHGRFLNGELMETLCRTFEVNYDFSTPEEGRQAAEELHVRCALRSTMYVVDRAREFAATNGKKLLLLLSHGAPSVEKACRGETRFDRELIDYLIENSIPFVDSLQKHVEDYRSFSITPDQYTKRYYIGHYSPVGNMFFAFAIKDALVDWLDPSPPAYR